jgi:hypothetical protein
MHSGGNALDWMIGGSNLSTDAGTPDARVSSLEGVAFGSATATCSTGAKARDALWAAMCFNMSVADWIGSSHILFMLIPCPQSLHVIKVPPAVFLIVVYMH